MSDRPPLLRKDFWVGRRSRKGDLIAAATGFLLGLAFAVLAEDWIDAKGEWLLRWLGVDA